MEKLIVTKRLAIRKFAQDDGAGIREYAEYKESAGFETFNKWPTDSEGCDKLAASFAESDAYWAVCRKRTGKFIGFISFNSIDGNRRLDLGHGFIPEYNQAGEDVEALAEMIQYAFKNLNIAAIYARNEKEWTAQSAPLCELGFVQFDGMMCLTIDAWLNRE